MVDSNNESKSNTLIGELKTSFKSELVLYSRIRVIYVRVIYDGTGNFQTFWRKPIVTQIRVIYNFLGTGNFEPDIFEKLFIPSDLS